MKKLALLCGVALALGFTACDDELPNPEGQKNPQLEIFDSANLALSQVENGAEKAINLQTLADAGEKAVLANITELTDFPADYDLVFKVDMSTTEDFAKSVTIDVPAEFNEEDSVASVAASTINSAIYDNFTKDPAQITLYTRWAAYAVSDLSTMRLGGKDKLYAEYTYDFVPFTPDRILSTAYSLKYKAAGADWAYMDMTKAVEGSVYDDGLFTVQVDVLEAGFQWMVIPTANIQSQEGLIGVETATAASGALVEGEGAVAGEINNNSPYLITIDVVNMTYKVTLAFEQLWVPGSATGTSVKSALKLFTTDYVTYDGTLRLYNDWYISAQSTKKGISFMLDGEQTVSEQGVLKGSLVQVANGEGTNMTAENGLYYIKVNLGTMEYSATPIKQISVIGAFNEWNLETAVDLTPNARFQKWTANGVKLTAGEYKFCVDHSWTICYGGQADDLVQNGANLMLDEDGTYDIELDFTKQPNKLKITKK